MRVVIHDLSLFDAGDKALYDQLRRLFIRASRGQHKLEVADQDLDQDINRLLESDFMRVACADMDRPTWQELLLRTSGDPFATTENPRRQVKIVRSSGASSAWEIVAHEVGDWAEKPLRVLLENQADAVLIRLVSRLTPGILAQALDNEWVVPYGCGGTGEVKKRVEDCGASERLFVLIDSDRESTTDRMSDTAKKICVACQKAGVELHVLERRELENYVPDAVWNLAVEPWKKNNRGEGSEKRSVLVYRWIERQLHKHGEYLTSKHSRQALTDVRKNIEKLASADVSARLLHKLLDEWSRLNADDKAVDDLKERFGKKLTQQAIKLLDDENFSLAWLDNAAVDELTRIGVKIEEWL